MRSHSSEASIPPAFIEPDCELLEFTELGIYFRMPRRARKLSLVDGGMRSCGIAQKPRRARTLSLVDGGMRCRKGIASRGVSTYSRVLRCRALFFAFLPAFNVADQQISCACCPVLQRIWYMV